MAYITIVELAAYIRSDIGAVDDDLLTEIASAASAEVDRFCQRSFAVAGASSARVFVPNDDVVLPIYDATAVSAITESGTALASTYWQAEPVNGLDGAGQTVPYSSIRRIDGLRWCQTSSYPGKASISVTATWGWSATPAAVTQATRLIAKAMIEERNTRNGLVDFGEFAARSSSSPAVARLLGPLRSGRSWGMA